MAIFTIGDLHLAFKENKPMYIFGENWKNHYEKIKKNWLENVNENDLVILPGDFSWAMRLKDTDKDFEYLCGLPGKKLLLKGNHDYWWETITKMRRFLKEKNFDNIDFLYNNSFKFENYVIAGTRGWNIAESEEDKKIYCREVQRLEMSLEQATNIKENNDEIIVFMHYPPITKISLLTNNQLDFVKVMKKYKIKKCYYAHLHGTSINDAVEGEHYGINFKLVSADKLDFKLLKIQ